MNSKKPVTIPLPPKASLDDTFEVRGEPLTPKQQALLNLGRVITDDPVRQCVEMGLAVIITLAYPEEGDSTPEFLHPHATNTRLYGHRDGIIQGLINSIRELGPPHQRFIFELLKQHPNFAEMRELKGVSVEVIATDPKSLKVN